MGKRTILVSLLIVAIAIGGVSAALLNNNPRVTSSSSSLYRYKVKFECKWEKEIVGPVGAPTLPSQRIPVETLITTHINVYNPDHRIEVRGFKYFVQVLPEPWLEPFLGGHTMKNYTFFLPPNKGFEIDCDDIRRWPIDPTQPPLPPYPSELKGFVIIESVDYPLEVVAVYNKKSADIVNKITFHSWWWPRISPIYLETEKGSLTLYEQYSIISHIPIPPEMDTELLISELKPKNWLVPIAGVRIIIPFEPDDTDPEILSTETYFDFLECDTKQRVRFTLKPLDRLVEKYLNIVWPVEKRPKGFVWPDWIWPCRKYELIVKPLNIDTEPILDPVKIVKDEMKRELIALGVPEDIIGYILTDCIWPYVVEFDVAEGVGTGIDVEYIEPEVIATVK